MELQALDGGWGGKNLKPDEKGLLKSRLLLKPGLLLKPRLVLGRLNKQMK